MEMTDKSAKIYTIITGIFLVTSIMLLIVDYQLKNSIIDESQKLRRMIYGQGDEGQDYLRYNSNGRRYDTIPFDMVDSRDARMETECDNDPPDSTAGGNGRAYLTPEDGNT